MNLSHQPWRRWWRALRGAEGRAVAWRVCGCGVRELVQIMCNLNNDANAPMFMYPHVHAGVDEGFKKKIRSGDAVGFERYAPRLRAALNASPSLCEFVEAHVLVQSNASACFNAHVDRLQGDNDAHPVGHATVFHLGDAMKLAFL